jgi:16S rRNA (guanine966-N2)-methyltransferase
MRIISGKWGGRRLVSFKSDAIRPTTDRVKETVFNIIGGDIVGSSFLDLFCGTGSMTFEALSRGASEVVCVDKGKDSKSIISKNAEILEAKKDFKFISSDVFKFLERNKKAFDLIFIDPPFTQKMGAEVMKKLAQSKALGPDCLVFIEYVRGEEIYDPKGGPLAIYKERDYKDKLMYVYSCESEEES